jgi:hypothetical protein
MKSKKEKMIKMNLSIDKEFYALLQKKAQEDYVRVSTWTKQFLMKSLLGKNNGKKGNCLINDEYSM